MDSMDALAARATNILHLAAVNIDDGAGFFLSLYGAQLMSVNPALVRAVAEVAELSMQLAVEREIQEAIDFQVRAHWNGCGFVFIRLCVCVVRCCLYSWMVRSLCFTWSAT
jgi:hypothetical protein